MVAFDTPATVTIERGAQRLRCKVVEWDEGQVRCEPLRAGVDALAFLIPRSVVMVAWSTEKELRTVNAAVQGRPEDGIVTLAVDGPVTSVQRRDRIRARCAFPCHVAVADPDGVRIVTGETIDLSATGVGVRATLGVETGTSVAVAVFPTDDEMPLLAGRIVSTVQETGRVGIAFGSVLPGQLDRVSNLVAKLLSNRATR